MYGGVVSQSHQSNPQAGDEAVPKTPRPQMEGAGQKVATRSKRSEGGSGRDSASVAQSQTSRRHSLSTPCGSGTQIRTMLVVPEKNGAAVGEVQRHGGDSSDDVIRGHTPYVGEHQTHAHYHRNPDWKKGAGGGIQAHVV